MIKSFSLIVLTHFFQFNELKILRQPGFKLNHRAIRVTQHLISHLMW